MMTLTCDRLSDSPQHWLLYHGSTHLVDGSTGIT